jgi:CO dehydrogenase/acetyl-CoA synthase beta subunit
MTTQKHADDIQLAKKGHPPLQETLETLKKEAAEIADEKQGNDKTENESIEEFQTKPLSALENAKGKIGVPILLYILGVPGFVVILLWLFFFRGN